MGGLILVALLALALTLALEPAHRRRSVLSVGHGDLDDRDRARTRLDLLALAGRAEPLAHKPLTASQHPRQDWPRITRPISE
jgi:hypothetical protein